MAAIHPVVAAVTARVAARSAATRAAYLAEVNARRDARPSRARLACGNLAHGFAACNASDKAMLSGEQAPNLAIVTAYNDMLSAHQPFEAYPALLRAAARAAGMIHFLRLASPRGAPRPRSSAPRHAARPLHGPLTFPVEDPRPS